MKCPNCKEELKDNLKMSDTGETTYKLYLDAEGKISFEVDETYFDGNQILYCGSCGKELFPYDEEKVKKVLEGGDLNEMSKL